jgi:hypothetical protein
MCPPAACDAAGGSYLNGFFVKKSKNSFNGIVNGIVL